VGSRFQSLCIVNSFPKFRYHPNPIATGSIVSSDEACECCGQVRGYVYCTSPYGENGIEYVCPWCIADGAASRKFGAVFADSSPLSKANIAEEIIDEVTLRTPGYLSWQQEEWIACCDDACEFHGDADPGELAALDGDDRLRIANDFELPIGDFEKLLMRYRPKGSPAIYKFKCRHCGSVHYNWDCH